LSYFNSTIPGLDFDFTIPAYNLLMNITYTLVATIINSVGGQTSTSVNFHTYMIPEILLESQTYYRWNQIRVAPELNPMYCTYLAISSSEFVYRYEGRINNVSVTKYLSNDTRSLLFRLTRLIHWQLIAFL
jgi:hypothetical protein